jgi:hypothetical protein
MSAGFFVAPIRKRLFGKAFFEKHYPELVKDKNKRLPELGSVAAGTVIARPTTPIVTDDNRIS